MKGGFRQSQAWLHTWSGVFLGWLLFAIFLTGTVSYFQDEITHWMHPERHGLHDAPVDLDASLRTLADVAGNAPQWSLSLPTTRRPTVEAYWRSPEARRFNHATLDPGNGVQVEERPSEGGNFFYRFHFQLWHMDVLTARYLIGVATMFMFVALISGIVTHKKIFKDFFTFRPGKGQRSWLDGHNATAVLALPFHLMITFTGLVIFAYLYMPWGMMDRYGDDSAAFFAEVFPQPEQSAPSGKPAPLPPLTPLLRQAEQVWGGLPVGRVTVTNPGDAAATIELAQGAESSVSGSGLRLLFDSQGQLIREYGQLKPVALVSRVMIGLHLGRFAEPLLRWLYFLSGVAGTIMVASGLVLWVVKRTAQGNGSPGYGLRLVRVLNVGAVAGLVTAMAAYFYANRLLPDHLPARDEWEIHAFFGMWALALLHSACRPHKRAWVEQVAIAGLMFAGIPLLDALTGHFRWPATLHYLDWILFGFDATCLVAGITLGWLSWKIARHQPRKKAERPTRAPARTAGVAATSMPGEPQA